MRRGRVRPRPTGPRALQGSPEARRAAFVLLRTLSGVSGPQESAEALGVALPRYYQLETRALQAMVSALEPRARGRQPDGKKELERLQAEAQRLRRELSRYQALNRAAQRALGLASKPEVGRAQSAAKRVRRRRQRSRGERVAEVLKASAETPSGTAGGEGEVPS